MSFFIFDRTDQKILRGMFHINKFKDLCTISLRFKQFRTAQEKLLTVLEIAYPEGAISEDTITESTEEAFLL